MTHQQSSSEHHGLEDEYEEDYDEERLDLEGMDISELLHVAVDSDTENDDRVIAIEKLIELGPSSMAAIRWLMHSRYLARLDGYNHRLEVDELIAGPRASDEDQQAGLKIIIENSRLSDLDRARAFAKSLGQGPERAARYIVHKQLIQIKVLIFGLEEMLNGEDSLSAIDVIREIAADCTLMDKERVRAVTALTDDGNYRDMALELFQQLLQDPTLTDAAAQKDAKEWVDTLAR